MNLDYIDNDYAQGWMQNDYTSRRFVKLRLAYIDICEGNFYDATLLSAIMYWHEPSSETGKTRLDRFRDGHFWITKNHSDWYKDCRLKASTARKCMDRLKEMDLIYYELHGEQGKKTPWIRMNWETFETKMKQWVEDNTPATAGQGVDTTGQGTDTTEQPPLLPQDESNTKSGSESTSEREKGAREGREEEKDKEQKRQTQPFTVMPNKNEFDQFRVKTFPIRQYSDGKPIEPMIGGVFHAECINLFKAWQDAMSKHGISSDDDPATIWDENKRRIMQLAANRRTPEQVRAYVLSKYEQGDQWHKNNKAPVTIKNIVDGIAVFIDTQPKPQAPLPDIELPPADVDEGVVVPNVEPEDISA